MTDEPASLVDEWVAKHKPQYPIAILPDGAFEKAIGLRFFPYASVISPGGRIAYAGDARSYSDILEEALEESEKGPASPKIVAKAAKLLAQDKLDKAYGELLDLVAGGDLSESDLAAVVHFREFLERQASTALETAQGSQAAGYYYKALTLVRTYAEAEPAFPVTADCQALVAELEAVPEFKREMKGGEDYEEAEALYRDGEYTDAAEAFKSIYKKYKGTRISEKAYEFARIIVDKGFPGKRSDCTQCRQAKRACARHEEEVDL